MGRARKIDRPKAVELQLPTSIVEAVKRKLSVEGKVPFGAMSYLGEKLFTQWLEDTELEI